MYPNFFLFVTAGASAGKGRLTLCRHLAEPIDDALHQQCDDEEKEYKKKMQEFKSAKNKAGLEMPEEPPMLMHYIPANSSATVVYQILNDNGGKGMMFESEGDTANIFASDYGKYSDGFRKAFHHENISFARRKDRERVFIKEPKLSALLPALRTRFSRSSPMPRTACSRVSRFTACRPNSSGSVPSPTRTRSPRTNSFWNSEPR